MSDGHDQEPGQQGAGGTCSAVVDRRPTRFRRRPHHCRSNRWQAPRGGASATTAWLMMGRDLFCFRAVKGSVLSGPAVVDGDQDEKGELLPSPLRPPAAAGGGTEFETLVVLDPFPAPGQAIELEGGRAPERLPVGIEYEVRPTFGWCCLECGERNGDVFRRDAEETADRNDRGRHGAVLLNDEIDDPGRSSGRPDRRRFACSSLQWWCRPQAAS